MSMITTDIDLVLTSLERGDIVAIPTETVYGLAGNAENASAVHKIFAIKQRPMNHPLILHVGTQWQMSAWVTRIPAYAHRLIEAFWPGPLTLIFPCDLTKVNPLITGGQATLAIRCPRHPLTQALLTQLPFPLVAPSANPFGKVSPTTAEHVLQSFEKEDLLIYEGGRCEIGIESTIVDATNPEGYRILRHGMIQASQIDLILPQMELSGLSATRTSGTLAQHYQPQKPLYCFKSAQAIQQFCKQTHEKVYVLSFADPNSFSPHVAFQLAPHAKQVAYALYYQLRQADLSDASCIAFELPPFQQEWQGIIDRVTKASSIRND